MTTTKPTRKILLPHLEIEVLIGEGVRPASPLTPEAEQRLLTIFEEPLHSIFYREGRRDKSSWKEASRTRKNDGGLQLVVCELNHYEGTAYNVTLRPVSRLLEVVQIIPTPGMTLIHASPTSMSYSIERIPIDGRTYVEQVTYPCESCGFTLEFEP
ncbi:MAG TPA: hypothetical protein VJB87_04230 [Candidatus Nanoarchaeia archaeon]|nr:hypothetical protein [Candidatus Nanoarchaeia archaeon]